MDAIECLAFSRPALSLTPPCHHWCGWQYFADETIFNCWYLNFILSLCYSIVKCGQPWAILSSNYKDTEDGRHRWLWPFYKVTWTARAFRIDVISRARKFSMPLV